MSVGVRLTMESQEISKLVLLLTRGKPSIVEKEKHDVASDVKTLKSSLKFFSSKQKIIEILCSRTNRQRIDIAKAFKSTHGCDLLEVIKSKFRGNFRNLLVALLTPTNEFYCTELFEALNGCRTDEDALIEMLVTLSNRDIFDICQRYNKTYGRALETDLKSDTRGDFRKLMIALSNGVRDETGVVDLYQARIEAMDLKRAGLDRWGTDTSTFNRILCLRSFHQLRLIVSEYEFVTGHTLQKDIKKEFCGEMEEGLLAIIRCAQNRPQFLSRFLYKSLAGQAINDKSLIRILATRCEIDLLDIKEEFQKRHGKALKSFVTAGSSGHYRKALLKLIGE